MPEKLNHTVPDWLIPEYWSNDKVGEREQELSDAGMWTHEMALMYSWFARWEDEWEIDCSFCGNKDGNYAVEDCMAIVEFGLSHKYKCKKCRKRFSVTSGTWLANHKLPMEYWWRTAYLLGDFNISVNSHWLARDLKVPQKTSYYMLVVISRCLDIIKVTPMKTDMGTRDIMSALLTVRK